MLDIFSACAAGARVQKEMAVHEAPKNPRIRVVLVNNQPIVMWGLEKLLEQQDSDVELVGMLRNYAETKAVLTELKPDILLMDVGIRKGVVSAGDLVAYAVAMGCTRVLIFSSEAIAREDLEQSVTSGAAGLVYKEEATESLITAIQKVHAGGLWFDGKLTEKKFLQRKGERDNGELQSIAAAISLLSPKERQIVAALADMPGAQNKAIAAKMCMGTSTLRNYLTSIFSKLNITNRFDLFAFSTRYRDRVAQHA